MNRREAFRNAALGLGYVVTGPTLAKLFAETSRWRPVVLNDEQLLVVRAAADRILPRTDTPGAIDVGVDRVIDMMLSEVLDPTERAEFLKGVNNFFTLFEKLRGTPFYESSVSEQDRFLEGAYSDSRISYFFRKLKQLTLLGYFTSEEVGEQVLRYLPVPGDYKGCVAMNPEDRNWSIQ